MQTLEDLVGYVRNYFPDKPTAKVAAEGNIVLKEMARDVGPIKRKTFTTRLPSIGGTVSISQDDTTLTGVATGFSIANDPGQIVLITGDDSWFDIESVSSTTVLKISSKWAQATASGVTHTIAFPVVALHKEVLHLLEVGRIGKRPLQRVTDERLIPLSYDLTTGEPEFFGQAHFGSGGVMQIRLSRPPDARYVYTYSFRKRPSLFDGQNVKSTSDFPDVYDDALQFGVLYRLALQQKDAEAALLHKADFVKALRGVGAENAQALTVRLAVPRWQENRRIVHEHPVTST